MDSYEFEKPRKCVFLNKVFLSTGKEAAMVEIDPPLVGQKYGRPGDVKLVVLTHRHESYGLFPITFFPCFVHVAIPTDSDVTREELIDASSLQGIAWAELYRTENDALNHVFDKS